MYDEAEVPIIGGRAGQLAKSRKYNASPLGQQRKKESYARTAPRRSATSKWVTDNAYLGRQFIGWDGEGVTIDGEHKYVLLANSLGEKHVNENGIPFQDIMDWLLAVKHTHPTAINVGFALGYDFNCWLADLTEPDVKAIATRRSWNVRGYKVAWRHGKSFWVSPSGIQSDKGKKNGAIVYDAFPFFQRSFVAACDEYLGDSWEARDEILADKLRRSTFTLDELPRIIEYNRLELVNLVRLMDELRARLNKVTLRPQRWDGPGAIATALMRREGVKDALAESPLDVARAARHAYAGGRFEMEQWGVIGR